MHHVVDAALSAVRIDAGPSVSTRASQRSRRILIALAVAIAATLTYNLFDKFWLSKRVTSAAAPVAAAVAEKSIAVLPFVDMSEKKDQEYFADGMAEDIINLLAKVPDLRVPGADLVVLLQR